MKKHLLLAAGVLFASSAAMSEEATVAPTVYPGYCLTSISANGEWTVSVDPYGAGMTIINIKTGETWEYGDASGMETYEGGLNHFVSNNGVVVAMLNENFGMYWENGKWNELPCKDTDLNVSPKTITPDGSVIGGSVMRGAMSIEETDQVMVVPVVWYRNANGGYDNYVELPYPKVDWTGRVPQYVLLDDISADGKVCAGDVTDYSGMVEMPIVFKQKDNGEWEYAFVHPELVNPDNVEFPAYPGEAPAKPDVKEWMSPENADSYEEAVAEYNDRPYPQIMEFMTEDEIAAYNEAYAQYEADPYNVPYPYIGDSVSEDGMTAYYNAINEYYEALPPNPADYMTDEEIASYNAAVENYNIAAEQWNIEFTAFQEVLESVIGNPDIPAFSMNSSLISPNGKYFAMTGEKTTEDPDSWMGFTSVAIPYLFDLETNEVFIMDKGQDNVLAEQISDKGWVLGAAPIGSFTRQAFIARGPESAFKQLITIVEEQDADLYSWMKENMTHEVEDVDYVYNEETEEMDPVVTIKEEVFEGTTLASSDFSVFAGWLLNNWDFMDDNYVYSYLYGVNGGVDGINAVSAKARDFSISAQLGGIISINGEVANVTVYDIAGRKVFSADAPASQVSTGLTNGTYVVTAKAANGRMVTKKVVF